MTTDVCVYLGDALARYGFGQEHPFGVDRHDAFVKRFQQHGLDAKVTIKTPVDTDLDALERFHTSAYVQRVIAASSSGTGYLDCGDTPAFKGVYETARLVVGTALDATHQLINGQCARAFIPIAGLHHARRDIAAGFCVFNDCGVVIESLRKIYNINRVAYVDIDAHHGDGVYYEFSHDPQLIFVDFHEDGRYLYPGSGTEDETGSGPAKGTKLNINMPPEANDGTFLARWDEAESFLINAQPEFILFQCGADSLAGDPITHLNYTEATHAFVTRRLCKIADEMCDGRLLALGGGGYNRENLARAWCAVVSEMVG